MKTAMPSLGSIALLPLLLLLASGCLSVPLPSSRQSISSRKISDFEFPDPAWQSRSEVEKKLGKPDEYFPDLRVSVYPVNTVIRRRYYAFLGIIPVHFFRDYDAFDIGCVEFDEVERARCCGIITGCYGTNTLGLHLAGTEWLATRDAKGQGHDR
jgi:hypothetical protein